MGIRIRRGCRAMAHPCADLVEQGPDVDASARIEPEGGRGAVADLRRATRWAGLRPGDPVQVEGTRLRGATWQFVAHVTNSETGEAWVEVVGGRAGDRAVRSFRPDQLYDPCGPSGPRPLAGRRPGFRSRDSPGGAVGADGADRAAGGRGDPDPDDGAARPAALRARRHRRAGGPPRRGVVLVVPVAGRDDPRRNQPVPRAHTGALRDRRVRHRGAHRARVGHDDRLGRAGRAALPARDPAGGRGRVAPVQWTSGEKVWRRRRGPPRSTIGFTTGGLTRIVSIYEPENVASGRVMARLGFTHFVTTVGPRGEEVVVMELTKTQWQKRRQEGRERRWVTWRSRRPPRPSVGEGRHTATVHGDWEIWGPCGGYVAAIALRAAGADSPLVRPASFYCHYLSVAEFAPVDLVVTPLRSGRTVLAQRVEHDTAGAARPRGDGVVGRRRGRARARRRDAARRARARRAADVGGTACRRGRSRERGRGGGRGGREDVGRSTHSGTTSTSA